MAEAYDMKLPSGDNHALDLTDGKSNNGSGNGLVPSSNKLLPEPMLTQISVAIWRH